jgi:CRISPR-associated protein Cas2
MYLLVAYDVPAERTEKYRKLLSRYLSTLQFSVFAGDVTEVVYRRLRRELGALYQDSDRLVFVQTQNRRNIQVETISNGTVAKDTTHVDGLVI